MPTTDHGMPIPSNLDAPNGAAQMMALGAWVDNRLPYAATDSADRDARYYDLPAGALVSTSQAPWFLWLKSSAGNTWVTVLSDTGWVTTGFVAKAPNFGDGAYAKARNRNGLVEIRAAITNNGDPITALANGNVTDQLILTVPPQFATATETLFGRMRCNNTSGNVDMRTGGGVWLTDMNASSVIANGDTLHVHVMNLEG